MKYEYWGEMYTYNVYQHVDMISYSIATSFHLGFMQMTRIAQSYCWATNMDSFYHHIGVQMNNMDYKKDLSTNNHECHALSVVSD